MQDTDWIVAEWDNMDDSKIATVNYFVVFEQKAERSRSCVAISDVNPDFHFGDMVKC